MAERKTKAEGKGKASGGDPEDRKLKTCPKCLNTYQIGTGFGWRKMGDVLRPQSWCLSCRGIRAPKLTTDRDQTAKLFKETFPENNQNYGWTTMAKRLVAKIPNLILSAEADIELNGTGI